MNRIIPPLSFVVFSGLALLVGPSIADGLGLTGFLERFILGVGLGLLAVIGYLTVERAVNA